MNFEPVRGMGRILRMIRRDFVRNPMATCINIVGLSLTVAVVLHIGKVVQYQHGFDKVRTSEYRVWMETWRDGDLQTSEGVTYPAVANVLQSYNEVVHISRSIGFTGILQTTEWEGRTIILETDQRIWCVEPEFLQMFPIDVTEGHAALENPFEVLVSQRIVDTYFNGESPVGQIIEEDGEEPFMITGVFADLDDQSFFTPDFIRSYASLAAHYENLTGRPTTIPTDSWDWPRMQIFFQLQAGADLTQLKSNLNRDIQEIKGLEDHIQEKYHLQPVPAMHLTSDAGEPFGTLGTLSKRLGYALLAAVLIVLITTINFFNLLLSNNLARAQEVGVRSVIGADRYSLFMQFVVENGWLIGTSFLIGMMLFELTAPLTSNLLQTTVPGLLTTDVLILACIALFLVLLASAFPLVVLMKTKPSFLLQGNLKPSGIWMFARRIFITIQFAVTMFLLVAVFVVYQQVNFMMRKEPGFTLEQLLVVKGPRNFDYETFSSNPDYIKNQLKALASVEDVTTSYSVPGKNMGAYELRRVGAQETAGRFYSSETDMNYLRFFGLEFIAGRNFSVDTQADDHTVILNESAMHMFGFESPEQALGEWITSPEQGNNREVIGIVKDVHHLSLHKGFLPTTYSLDPESRGFYTLKISQPSEQVITNVKAVFDQVFEGNSFEYFYLKDSFYEQYAADKVQNQVMGILLAISITLSCFGLFAIAALVINSRTREVGIRKILGASIHKLFGMITFRFLKLIILSSVLVIPISYVLLDQWLDGFAFRIAIDFWMLLLPFVITLFMALLTISYQSAKVSLINPVDTLRDE